MLRPRNQITHLELKSSERLVYLDNLRSAAMLLGVFVHTATLENFGSAEIVSWLSDLFRMATFFLISGYLTAMLLSRRTASQYYRMRILTILVPLTSGIILLNPVTLWLILHYHNAELARVYRFSEMASLLFQIPTGVTGPFIWHLHLWFLFSLLFFTIFAPLAARIINSSFMKSAFAKLICGIPDIFIPTVIAIVTAGAVLILRIAYELIISPVVDYWLILITLEYLPFFLVGMVFYSCQKIWEKIHRIDLPLLVMSISLYYFVICLPDVTRDEQIGEALYLMAQGLVRCAISFFLLTVFRALMNWSTSLTIAVTDSIYTIYLFHFLCIYLVAVTLIDTSFASISSFFAVAVTTFLITFALHYFLVRRLRVLRFLFNGRW